MDDRGHRYMNLEERVGGGVCFTLGISLSETHWTKVLLKSGPEFEKCVRQIESTSAGRLARVYADLRDIVITAKLAQLNDAGRWQTTGLHSPRTPPMSSSASIETLNIVPTLEHECYGNAREEMRPSHTLPISSSASVNIMDFNWTLTNDDYENAYGEMRGLSVPHGVMPNQASPMAFFDQNGGYFLHQ